MCRDEYGRYGWIHRRVKQYKYMNPKLKLQYRSNLFMLFFIFEKKKIYILARKSKL